MTKARAIDESTLSSWQVQVAVTVQHFFEVTPIALLAGFGWSLFSLLRFKLGDQTVQYEISRLYSTWMWFEGIVPPQMVRFAIHHTIRHMKNRVDKAPFKLRALLLLGGPSIGPVHLFDRDLRFVLRIPLERVPNVRIV